MRKGRHEMKVWINQATFTYADGVTQTVNSPSPCKPGAPQGAG